MTKLQRYLSMLVEGLFSLATYLAIGIGIFVLVASIIYAFVNWFAVIFYGIGAILVGFIAVSIFKEFDK